MNRSLGGLPLQLLTFVALPLLALLTLIAFGGVTLHRVAMRELIASHNVTAVRGAAISLSEQLEQQASILSVLSDRMKRGETPQEVIVSLGYLPETIFDGGIAFYDDQGRILAASPESREWQNAPEIADAVLTIESADHRLYIPLIVPGQNATRIAVVTHVLTSTENTGRDVLVVGVTSLDALGLSAVIKGFQAPGVTVYIVGPDGRIIYHSDPSQAGINVAEAPYLRAALRGESGANYTDHPDQGQTIIAFAPIPEAGWSLVQEQQWVETISPLMRYAEAAPLILLPGILIAGWAVWFGLRRVVRPLQALEKQAADLSWGDFDSIQQPVSGIAEVRNLQKSLQHMASRIRSYQADMHQYIAATARAQEDERARLARELHDHMVQALIAIDHRAQRLKRHLSRDPAGLALLDELRAMTGEAIDDLRRLIRDMRPLYLEDLGLVPALKVLALNAGERNGRDCQFAFVEDGTPFRLPPEHEISLYRVAQEALNNVRKHSGAGHATLSIRFQPDEVILSVRDDGRGFEVPRQPADLSREGHYGLIGMHERATLIGAHLHILSNPDSGTTVTMRLPVNGHGPKTG